MSFLNRIVLILLLSVISCFIFFFAVYKYVFNTVILNEVKNAKIQSKTIAYYQEELSNSALNLLKANSSDLLSLMLTSKIVASKLRNNDNFYIRLVSDRWRSIDNRPGIEEMKAIEFFKSHPKIDEYWEIHSEKDGFGIGTNEKHLFFAYPLYIKRSCLICHGNPEKDVPGKLYNDLVEKFGNKAFYYKEGDLRGIISMRIPIENIEKKLILIFLVVSGVAFLTIMLGVYVFIKLNQSVSEDISKILNFFKVKVANNKYEKITDEMNFIEFEKLKEEINKTIDTINNYKQKLATNHLTNLPNRTQFFEYLEENKKPIMILNIDKFREINSYFNTETGDELIKQVGKRLKDLAKKYNFEIFHLDIDEFALLPDKEFKEKSEILKYAQSIIRKLEESYFIYNNEILVRFRMGISFNSKEYIKAEMALSNAKKLKKDIVFDKDEIEVKDNYGEHSKWLRKLKSAIKNDRIIPFYQPIYDRNKNIVKYEALVRMIDEEGNVICPFFFLEVAKKSRFYLDITKLVLDKAIKTIRKYNVSISINITLEDMEDEEMRNFLIEQISECKYKNKITFEIVENEDIRQSETIKEFIAKLRHEGVSIYIDDFGSGYANFDYLLKLHPEGVKIDGSLIKNILVDQNAQVMVKTLVNFAKESGIYVVAEYVEDDATFNLLKEMGVDYFQGYYFSPPKPEI